MSSCREVYVAVFERHPTLVKIGKATVARRRLSKLEETHGKLLFAEFADYGDDCSKMERRLHKRFQDYRVKVPGDGGTEFFESSIKEAVLNSLATHSGFCLSSLEAKLQKEEERCSQFICKVSEGRKLGMWDFGCGSLWALSLKVSASIELGFDKCEAFRLAAEKMSKKRYITPKRLELLTKIAPDYKENLRYKLAYEAYNSACDRLGIPSKERYSSRTDYYMPNNWYNYSGYSL
jgi:hypothetical protein